MQLLHGLQLAYCTNIHRGESWEEIFERLQTHTMAVRDRVCPGKPYAIGLRLGEQAAFQLGDARTLADFQSWLEKKNCYIFTINGFPYGRFHGTRVKEDVYRPDWTSLARLEYTNRLFDLLATLLPAGLEGSVSTVPCSYKEFITTHEQENQMIANLWRCVEHIEKLSERTGKRFHLGLEPEPLCYIETSAETIEFFSRLRDYKPNDERLDRNLGVNYDNCHLAVEFEQPADVIAGFQRNGIKISKLHFSSALKVKPTPQARAALKSFVDIVYFHQVVARETNGTIKRYKDLDVALALPEQAITPGEEWRIHFHIPLHSEPREFFESTSDHILGVMDHLRQNPRLCSHIEMETYTWEVLPEELKRNVDDQLVAEYAWTLSRLAERGLADRSHISV
jgi:hypothetical protein